ncbi:hypothetical protein CH293_21235 [Rhodococcus sp. 14-2470-1b]|uniref:NAD(P)/FAD-dependent oxidoreductase n=1 Tax=Rhodococcus sp. 14-2470-1b TaxID=2023149 RepID=UPI000B9BA3DB|nr:NAD(P)-binding protein [Rhodococcus sp. 14-2470-1b]OZF46547.1 hypothetical protein CH293_21235 [Rhodococcus sp. 14-2470-1b]
MSTPSTPVTIVGAGMAGAACAVALRDGGVECRLVDRGRAVGGRMASPQLHGRRVDIGAGYFTVRDDGFAELVEAWKVAGLARPWTDTFGVLAPGADATTTTGPTRWATPGGLRSLVRDVLGGAGPGEITAESTELTALPDGIVVLAMPDPQASRLVDVPDPVNYDAALTVVAGFEDMPLPFENAAFVNAHPVIEFLADDGARRGDSAPVLVAHTTADFARAHLRDPESAVAQTVAAVRSVTGLRAPSWTHVHRWTFAKPAQAHDSTFRSVDLASGPVYFAGDQWSPSGPPRVESAWRSGTDAGRAICARLS